MKKLAIVSTHPIQYNAPWFALLHRRGIVNIKVFYTWSQSQKGPIYDPTFKRVVEWDIPLLNGYEYEFVHNISKEPGSHHFKGVDNPTLATKIAEWQPDAVLIIGWSFKSHLSCMRRFKGKITVLFRGDSTLLDEKGTIKKLIRRIFLTWVYKNVDKVLYVGTNNKRYFKVHGVKESQLIPALHAIENRRFSHLSHEQSEGVHDLKSKLNISDSHFVILFAGKLEEKKNPHFLLELAKRTEDPEMVFLFVGNGHLEYELKQESVNDKRIKFLDFQNQSVMPSVYALASVFILPSKGPGETWGLAANEAMASGIPVILSTKVGGAIDLVNKNGLIFEPSDVESVNSYILDLKSHPEKLKNAREASRKHIEKFNFIQLVEAVEAACLL